MTIARITIDVDDHVQLGALVARCLEDRLRVAIEPVPLPGRPAITIQQLPNTSVAAPATATITNAGAAEVPPPIPVTPKPGVKDDPALIVAIADAWSAAKAAGRPVEAAIKSVPGAGSKSNAYRLLKLGRDAGLLATAAVNVEAD